MDQVEGFLAREAELFFLGVTEDFFSLITLTVDWGDAAVVNGFLKVVEGACVVWRPAFDVTEVSLYMGVVSATLCVQWLYGLTRRVVWGLEKG